MCQKNKWNIPCLKASHRRKSQHSQDANLQSGVRDMTESIFLLTWTKHKLRLMHCPSPSCWTLGHVTSFVIELLYSPQGKLYLCPSCFLYALLLRIFCSPEMETWGQTSAAVTPAVLSQHWRGSEQVPKKLLEILTAHLMHNNLERYIWSSRGILWFPTRRIIAVDSRINILYSHRQECNSQY